MPQFQFADNLVPQLAWLAVFFSILYFGIVKTTLPRVGRVVEAREGQVKSDVAAADAAKHEADRLDLDYGRGVDAAHGQARATVATATEAAAARRATLVTAADARLDERTEAAEREVERARLDAVAQVDAVAADAAADIVERLTGRRPDAAAAQAAVARAVAA